MSAEDIIAKQLEYYNNKDLGRFSSLFANDIVAYPFPNWQKPLFSGKEALVERYRDRFRSSPDLNSHLRSRIAVGDIVIDDEDIEGFNGQDDRVRIIAIYEVKDDLITRMWFIKGDEIPDKIVPVETQLQGYNSQDIDLFLSAYSDDCQIFDLQSGFIRMNGKEAMREGYKDLFEKSSDLNAKIVNRMYLGDIVIDHEEVSGFRDNQVVEAIAYNEVKDGLITRVWFSK